MTCGIINTESKRDTKPLKKKKKKKKALDKIPNLWYNKDVSERDKKSPLNKCLVVAKRHKNLATPFRVATNAGRIDTMADKMTNVKAINYALDNCDLPADVREKFEAMKASFEKRNASKAGKPSKKATENAETAKRVIAAMVEGETYDTNGIKALLGDSDLTPQKVTAVMKTLGDCVVAEKVKGKAVYRLA